jgi:hypothetical protein
MRIRLPTTTISSSPDDAATSPERPETMRQRVSRMAGKLVPRTSKLPGRSDASTRGPAERGSNARERAFGNALIVRTIASELDKTDDLVALVRGTNRSVAGALGHELNAVDERGKLLHKAIAFMALPPKQPRSAGDLAAAAPGARPAYDPGKGLALLRKLAGLGDAATSAEAMQALLSTIPGMRTAAVSKEDERLQATGLVHACLLHLRNDLSDAELKGIASQALHLALHSEPRKRGHRLGGLTLPSVRQDKTSNAAIKIATDSLRGLRDTSIDQSLADQVTAALCKAPSASGRQLLKLRWAYHAVASAEQKLNTNNAILGEGRSALLGRM